MFTRKEAAEELNVPEHTVKYWTQQGKLKGSKFDLAGNKIYYKKEDIENIKKELKERFD